MFNWFLLGFGTVLSISGGISLIIMINILNIAYSDPSVLTAAGSVVLGVGCIVLQLVWNPSKWA